MYKQHIKGGWANQNGLTRSSVEKEKWWLTWVVLHAPEPNDNIRTYILLSYPFLVRQHIQIKSKWQSIQRSMFAIGLTFILAV